MSTPSSGISRRSLAVGAAWAVPAVAVAAAAPAQAVSGCIVQTNFDGLVVGTCPTTISFAPSAVTATISYSSTGNGGDSTPGDTCRVERTNAAPPTVNWNYIEVEMLSPLVVGDTVTVTITLSQPMENVSFKLHDIDWVDGAWRDQVIVSPSTGYTVQLGSGLVGAGTSASPITPPSALGDYPITSGRGDAIVTWAGPIQVVSFTYRAGITGNSQNQHIGLGSISFSDCIAYGVAATAPTRSVALTTGGGGVITGVESQGASIQDSSEVDAAQLKVDAAQKKVDAAQKKVDAAQPGADAQMAVDEAEVSAADQVGVSAAQQELDAAKLELEAAHSDLLAAQQKFDAATTAPVEIWDL